MPAIAVHSTIMVEYVKRTLTLVNEQRELQRVADDDLEQFHRSLIVLGEPGMGKTELLRKLAQRPDYVFRSAASFATHPAPARILSPGQTMVIDGLDELSAVAEFDPIYRVLEKLIAAGIPRFILSCRAADWRGAGARQDIADEYGAPPLELTLEPFSRSDAIAYLTASLGDERANEVVTYLVGKGIPDLFGNPLSLKLFGEVAVPGSPLPETRADLLRAATERMWSERNDRHAGSMLSTMDTATAMKAAGAVSAAYILTGTQAISLRPSNSNLEDVLPIAEIRALPDGAAAHAVLGSRLFQKVADAEDQFKPIHRSVAEYLGAGWLAGVAHDNLSRARILAMMTIDSGVPASIRGLYGWLARDHEFAGQVIATDPYAVLRYGDPDSLTVQQGRALLEALQALEQSDPFFRAEDWGRLSAKGLARLELREDIRPLLFDTDTGVHLRSLLLSAIKGSELAASLADDLRSMTLSGKGEFTYVERYEAARALTSVGHARSDLPAVVDALIDLRDEDSTRMAIELIDDIGPESLSSQRIAHAILSFLGLLDNPAAVEREQIVLGPLWLLARDLPAPLIPEVLNALAAHLPSWKFKDDRPENSQLTETVMQLVARQIDISPPEPHQLLEWLGTTSGRHNYTPDLHTALAGFFSEHAEFRRAIQRLVIFDQIDLRPVDIQDFHAA